MCTEPAPQRPNQGIAAKVDISLPADEEQEQVEQALNNISYPRSSNLMMNGSGPNINKDLYDKVSRTNMKKINVETNVTNNNVSAGAAKSTNLMQFSSAPNSVANSANNVIPHFSQLLSANTSSRNDNVSVNTSIIQAGSSNGFQSLTEATNSVLPLFNDLLSTSSYDNSPVPTQMSNFSSESDSESFVQQQQLSDNSLNHLPAVSLINASNNSVANSELDYMPAFSQIHSSAPHDEASMPLSSFNLPDISALNLQAALNNLSTNSNISTSASGLIPNISTMYSSSRSKEFDSSKSDDRSSSISRSKNNGAAAAATQSTNEQNNSQIDSKSSELNIPVFLK